MKKLLLMGAGVGLAVFGGLVWVMPLRNAPPPAEAAAEPAVEVSESSLDSTLLVTTAYVGAGGAEPLLARTQGHVRAIFFSGGDYARRGQVLVKLDNHTFVTAPRAGFLGRGQLTIGQYLTATTAVTTLSRRSYLLVSLLLPASWPGSIHPGDSARVWATGRRPRVATGVVSLMAASGPADMAVEIALTSRAPFRIGEQVYVRLRDTGPELAAR